MDRVHHLLGHDDGDLGAVVRAARALDAGAASTIWPASTSRPGGDGGGGAGHSFASSMSMFSPQFPCAAACSSSQQRIHCRSAPLVPLQLPNQLMGTTSPGPAAFRQQDMSQLLHSNEQIRVPAVAASCSSMFDGMQDVGMASSASRFTGVLDSAPSFSSSSCRATWVPGNKDAGTSARLAPHGRIDSTPEFRGDSVLANFLRGYNLTVGKGNDSMASADARPESYSSHATVLQSRASSARVSATPEFDQVISDLQRSLASPISALSSKTVEDHSSSVKQQGCLTAQNSSSSTKGRGAKRRKAQQKRVVCIPASGGARRPTGECLPSDLWAWRKYGQKPIKGSPHPRGYYRCSSSKGCPARKQVERSRTDPSMLIVTYTSDHNHPWPTYRNALAGSTRPSSLEKSSAQSPDQCPASAPTTAPSGASSCEPSPDNPPGASLTDSPELAAAELEAECHIDSPACSPELAASKTEAEQSVEGGSTLVVDVDDAYSPVHDHGLHVLSSSNIPDTLFCEPDDHLGGEAFTSFGRQVHDERSVVDEGESATVDPYNLFNWSSTTFTRMDDVVR